MKTCFIHASEVPDRSGIAGDVYRESLDADGRRALLVEDVQDHAHYDKAYDFCLRYGMGPTRTSLCVCITQNQLDSQAGSKKKVPRPAF